MARLQKRAILTSGATLTPLMRSARGRRRAHGGGRQGFGQIALAGLDDLLSAGLGEANESSIIENARTRIASPSPAADQG